MPFGTDRTTETYFHGPVVSTGQAKRLDADINRALEGIGWLAVCGKVPVAGVGGVVRARVRTDRLERKYPLGFVHGYELKRRRLEKLIERIGATPVSERSRRIPGLQKEREDIILAGAMVVAGVMRKTGARIRPPGNRHHYLALPQSPARQAGTSPSSCRKHGTACNSLRNASARGSRLSWAAPDGPGGLSRAE